MGDDLRVASSRESVAFALELPAEIVEVVDLAVEDDAERAVLVRDRRVAVLDVDDRETVLADRTTTVNERTFGIRAAVALTRELCPDDFLRGGPRPVHEPGDPAHAA